MTQTVRVDGTSSAHVQAGLDALRPSGGFLSLAAGTYAVEDTLIVDSGVSVVGAGPGATRLVLTPGPWRHIITNRNAEGRSEGISLRGLTLDGSRASLTPAPEARILKACGAVFFNVSDLVIEAVDAVHVWQTAFQLYQCTAVRITDVRCTEMGYSAVATTRSDDVVLRGVVARDSGVHEPHSALHFGGGRGIYVDAVIERCTGNGVMIDSKNGTLSGAVVRATCRDSKVGVLLAGTEDHELGNVLISGDYSHNLQCGVMVSNASNVFVVDAVFEANGQHGIVLQGRLGAKAVRRRRLHVSRQSGRCGGVARQQGQLSGAQPHARSSCVRSVDVRVAREASWAA